MKNIESRIAVFREMLASVNSIYFTEYDAGFNVICSNSPHLDLFNLFFELDSGKADSYDINETMDSLVETLNKPTIFINSIGMTWLSDVLIRNGKIERIYLLGPAFLDDYTVKRIEPQLNRVHFSIPMKQQFMKLIRELPVISLNRYYEYGIMLHCCLTGEKISSSDFIYPDFEKKEDIKEQVSRDYRGMYMAEVQFLKLVEEGNLEYKTAKEALRAIGDGPNLAKSDYLRQAKNTVIVFCTLCSRAAIRGGLPSETAFILYEQYIQAVEAAENLSKVNEINQRMLDDFIRRVHRARTQGGISPQIKDSCDYICMHLEEKVDIHQLAERIGYTDYYFSNKFKKETGMSVRDYATQKKIERAKELLENSNLEIQDISISLGYGSQSYFGDVFRKETGMSPGEYRLKKKEG